MSIKIINYLKGYFKMDVLFATGNPAKVKSYYEKLKEKGINLLTIKDIDVKVDVEENGKNAFDVYNKIDGTLWNMSHRVEMEDAVENALRLSSALACGLWEL